MYHPTKLNDFAAAYLKFAKACASWDDFEHLIMDQDEWVFIAENVGLCDNAWIELNEPTDEMNEVMDKVEMEVFGKTCG